MVPSSRPERSASRSGFDDLRRLWRTRGERGASTVEYVGVIVVVSIVIIATAATPWKTDLNAGIEKSICSILSHIPGGGGGACESLESPEDDLPTCMVSEETDGHGSKVDVLIFNLGGGVQMRVTKYSDGSAEVSLVDQWGGGVDVDAGKVKAGDYVEIDLGVGGQFTYGNGDTWVFDSWEDAEQFAQDQQDRVEAWQNKVPFIGPWLNPHEPPEDPQKTYDQFELDLHGGGDAGLDLGGGDDKNDGSGDAGDGSGDSGSGDSGSGDSGSGDDSGDSGESDGGGANIPQEIVDLLPEAGGELSLGGEVIVEHDRGSDRDSASDDRRTYSIELNGDISGEGGVLDESIGGNAGAGTILSYTVDNDGNVVGVNLTQVFQAGGDGTTDNSAVRYSADFDLTDPAARQKFQDWIQNPGGIPNLGDIQDGGFEGALTPEQQGLMDLIQDPNVTDLTENHYDNAFSDDGDEWGGKLFGIGLGYGFNDDSSSSTLNDAYVWRHGPNGWERIQNVDCLGQ